MAGNQSKRPTQGVGESQKNISRGDTMAYPTIETKFLGATNYRGERVKASWSDSRYTESITLAWDYSRNQFENHQRVAENLALQMWSRSLEAGETIRLIAGAKPRGYVFIREYFGDVVEINQESGFNVLVHGRPIGLR